jgi:hypothetical protein
MLKVGQQYRLIGGHTSVKGKTVTLVALADISRGSYSVTVKLPNGKELKCLATSLEELSGPAPTPTVAPTAAAKTGTPIDTAVVGIEGIEVKKDTRGGYNVRYVGPTPKGNRSNADKEAWRVIGTTMSTIQNKLQRLGYHTYWPSGGTLLIVTGNPT